MSKGNIFEGIVVGGHKSNTLDNAFQEVAKRVEAIMGIKITAKDISEASEGLSPQTSGSLDVCLKEFHSRLMQNKIQLQPNGNWTEK